MKHIKFIIFIFLFYPLFLFGQNVNLQLFPTPSTCFANGTITIEIVGSDSGNLTQINYNVENTTTGDTRSGSVPFFANLPKGEYIVTMYAFFQATYIIKTATTIVDGDYIAPTAFKINDYILIGTRKTFNCKNSGRVSLEIKGGVFPYIIETYLDNSIHRRDTFPTFQNLGTDSLLPDYKNFYNIV